jgi:trimeric autotransporter adhesin
MQLSDAAAAPLCVYPAMAVSAKLPAAAPKPLYCNPPAKAAGAPTAAVASSVTVALLVAAALTAAVLWRRKRRGAPLCCCSAPLLSKAPSARQSPKPNSMPMREWTDSTRSLGTGRSGSHKDVSSGSSATAQLLRTGTSGSAVETVPYSSSAGRACSMLLEDDVEQGCADATGSTTAAALAAGGTVSAACVELPAADSALAADEAAAAADSTALQLQVVPMAARWSSPPAVALVALAPTDCAAAAATSTASLAASDSAAAFKDATTAANATTPRSALAAVAPATDTADAATDPATTVATTTLPATAAAAAATVAFTTALAVAASGGVTAAAAAAEPKKQLRTFRAAASRLRATASRGFTVALQQGEQHRAHIETAWDLAGAVASHLPYVRDAYGLCDEVVKLFSASTTISSNCAEVVAWALQMQVSQCTARYLCICDVLCGDMYKPSARGLVRCNTSAVLMRTVSCRVAVIRYSLDEPADFHYCNAV